MPLITPSEIVEPLLHKAFNQNRGCVQSDNLARHRHLTHIRGLLEDQPSRPVGAAGRVSYRGVVDARAESGQLQVPLRVYLLRAGYCPCSALTWQQVDGRRI